MTHKTIPEREKERHEHAIIINLSGHRVPQSVFEQLKKVPHETFSIYTQAVHIDIDEDIYQECLQQLNGLLQIENNRGQSLLEAEGEIYYVSCGHAQANLILYSALESLLGFAPHVVVTGIDKYKFHTYKCKSLFNMHAWKGRWRSIERNKYIKQFIELMSD